MEILNGIINIACQLKLYTTHKKMLSKDLSVTFNLDNALSVFRKFWEGHFEADDPD